MFRKIALGDCEPRWVDILVAAVELLFGKNKFVYFSGTLQTHTILGRYQEEACQ